MPDKNKIIFGTNNDTYIASDDAGNIILQHEEGNRISVTSDSILPATDEQVDLGSSANKFKDLYLSSDSIYIGNTKLSSDPATGALSTVVADEQGEFTSPAAPVGGGASGPFDWEATGFTHFGPALTNIFTSGSTGSPSVDALFNKFNQIGTDINFHDPIAIWNLTRGANNILEPEIHINGSRFGNPNNGNFSNIPNQDFQLWEMGYIDPPINSGIGVNFHGDGNYEMYLMTADEFDVHNANNKRFPVMLFKDENNEYFKDFLANTMLKHNLMDMVVSMEYEIIYTCSNSTTAANTPFFENTDADSDGIHRRTFTIMKFPDMLIRREKRFDNFPDSSMNFSAGRAFPNDITASENYRILDIGSIQSPYGDPRYQHYFSRGVDGSQGYYPTGGVYHNPSGTPARWYSTLALEDGEGGYLSTRHARGGYANSGMSGDFVNNAYWSIYNYQWSGDFFEGGICNHSDYTQGESTTYENDGRGCETKLRIKIK